MFNNKKLQLTKIELFIRSRKIFISLVFTSQSLFGAPKKNITLNSIQYFAMKILNKYHQKDKIPFEKKSFLKFSLNARRKVREGFKVIYFQ